MSAPLIDTSIPKIYGLQIGLQIMLVSLPMAVCFVRGHFGAVSVLFRCSIPVEQDFH